MRNRGRLEIYDPTAERVARTMVQSDAYRVREDEFFTWKSGIKAPVYTDCRVMMRHAGPRTLLKKALGSATLSNYGTPDYVIGVAEAGIVWSALLADELHTPTAFVRKQAKAHGVGGMLAGVPDRTEHRESATAVIVDDLVASGGSLVQSIDAIRDETHLEILGVISIVNWDFIAMRDRFRELRVPIVSLVSYPHLLAAAFEAERITEPQYLELLRFYKNPRGHQWSDEFRWNQDQRFGGGTAG